MYLKQSSMLVKTRHSRYFYHMNRKIYDRSLEKGTLPLILKILLQYRVITLLSHAFISHHYIWHRFSCSYLSFPLPMAVVWICFQFIFLYHLGKYIKCKIYWILISTNIFFTIIFKCIRFQYQTKL